MFKYAAGVEGCTEKITKTTIDETSAYQGWFRLNLRNVLKALHSGLNR